MSRREYKTINRRIQKGRETNTKKGLYVGSIPPYGYDKKKLKGEKGYELTINSREAKVVKLIFKCFNDDNMGTTNIAKYLNNLKIKPRKNSKWTASCVRNILTSPTNKGYLTWNKRKIQKNLNDGQISTARPISTDYILIKGRHEPIIDETLWNLTQSKINSKQKPRNNSKNKLQNPLAGIIFCADCQRKMIRRPYTNGYPDMLICNNPNCHMVGSNLNLVEQRIVNALEKLSKDYKYYLKTYNHKQENYKDIISLLDDEIVKTNKQIEKTYELVETGAYDKDLFVQRHKQLQEKLSTLKKHRNIKTKELDKKTDKIKSFIPKLDKVLKDYNKIIDIEDKNRLLSTIISKVIYSKDKGGRGLKDKFTLKIYPKI